MTEAPMVHPIPAVSTSIQRLAAAYPGFWADYEDADLDHPGTPVEVLHELLVRAPSPFATGLLAGRPLADPGLL